MPGPTRTWPRHPLGRRAGRKFAPRGRGHSVFGRSMARAGIVGDMSRLRAIRGPARPGRRRRRGDLERGACRDAAAWAHPARAHRLSRLSVGGTLVVGGVGGTTSRFGVQSDNVIAMDVVTGKGEKVTCSASRNADLFDAVRAGLGQVGVITRATLRLVPAPRQVRRFLLFYPDLRTMLKDARLLAGDGRFDAVQGAILAAPPVAGLPARRREAPHRDPPDDDALLAGLSDDPAQRQPSTLAYVDYLNRLAALEAALRANGQWFFPHPWLTTFVGDSRVESVVAASWPG